MHDQTTLVCLFHHHDRARTAERDLRNAGIPEESIVFITGSRGPIDDLGKLELASQGMPDRDYDHLKSGLRDGGVVLAVTAVAEQAKAIESIFEKHSAEKIDEPESQPAASMSNAVEELEGVVPIVQEDLVVGKRTVDQGGVRLYRKIVEIPVEESVNLREEHVRVNRLAIDRPITDQDPAFQPRSVELTETAEEVVVAKEARVVEEIVVSKDAIEHTETINDTIRHTEVEVQELTPTPHSTQLIDSALATSVTTVTICKSRVQITYKIPLRCQPTSRPCAPYGVPDLDGRLGAFNGQRAFGGGPKAGLGSPEERDAPPRGGSQPL